MFADFFRVVRGEESYALLDEKGFGEMLTLIFNNTEGLRNGGYSGVEPTRGIVDGLSFLFGDELPSQENALYPTFTWS